MEWFYRVCQDPTRLAGYLQDALPLSKRLPRQVAVHATQPRMDGLFKDLETEVISVLGDLAGLQRCIYDRTWLECNTDSLADGRVRMRQRLAALCVLLSCFTAGHPLAIAQSAATCPLNLSHLDLRYRHAGGNSEPQLNLAFTNISEMRLTRIVFAVSILDSGGYPRSYEDDLIYSKGAYPGKPVFYRWTLNPESVDIHHTGESVEVKEVDFADGSVWRGDGSPACTATVDFHPK